MIEVIHYLNEATEKPLEKLISSAYDDVRKLLPELPLKIKIYYSDYGILPHVGTSGFAYASDIITVSIDPSFDDKKKQRKSLRPTIFHEAFHIYQKFTGNGGPFSAIENAMYEGMATVFEREHAGVFEPLGDYRQIPEESLKQWAEELRKMSAEVFADEKVYSKWKFYHPQLKERWIVYRTGTWMIDQILKKQQLKILDLKDLTAGEVLDLYNK